MLIPLPVISLPILPQETADVPPAAPEIVMPSSITVTVEPERLPYVNAAEHSRPTHRMTWDDYVGQDPVKRKMRVHIDAAKNLGDPLPHTIFVSRMPGVGKTTLAEIIADEMGTKLWKMQPPFNRDTLIEAVLQCGDHDVLFIDEIHKMADNGPAMAEVLLPIMEERVVYIGTEAHYLNEFTVIGATTDGGKLPPAVLDRFMITPYFQKYTIPELIKITKTNFADRAGVRLTAEVLVAIGKACRRAPREARKLVLDAKALQDAQQRLCTVQELLTFAEIEPDGTSRQHIAYLTALYQFGARERTVGDRTFWEYVAGEVTLMNIVNEDKQRMAHIERFLMEQGMIDRTPRGRRLTDRGVARAAQYVASGNKLATG